MYECRACGRTYPADGPWRCACGHALDYAERYRPDRSRPPTHLDRERGVWAFEALLPVAERVSLGEGWTPLVDDATIDAVCKLEYLTPTGSFKDRGAAVTCSVADALGAERVLEDSSGNAGLAIATYAARAGVDATIYVPADAGGGTIRAIERTGARVIRIDGDRTAVAEACVAAVRDGEGWYASHAWNPAFLAGTATVAYEIAAQRDWTAPEAVVLPVGHGTLLLGAYRGFRALREVGWIDRVPRLCAVQGTGHAPVVEAVASRGGTAIESGRAPVNDRAAGIRIDRPARLDQIVEAIRRTDGAAVVAGPDATDRARTRLARAGFHVEPTSATALAGLATLRARGVLEQGSDVVLALTGANDHD